MEDFFRQHGGADSCAVADPLAVPTYLAQQVLLRELEPKIPDDEDLVDFILKEICLDAGLSLETVEWALYDAPYKLELESVWNAIAIVGCGLLGYVIYVSQFFREDEE